MTFKATKHGVLLSMITWLTCSCVDSSSTNEILSKQVAQMEALRLAFESKSNEINEPIKQMAKSFEELKLSYINDFSAISQAANQVSQLVMNFSKQDFDQVQKSWVKIESDLALLSSSSSKLSEFLNDNKSTFKDLSSAFSDKGFFQKNLASLTKNISTFNKLLENNNVEQIADTLYCKVDELNDQIQSHIMVIMTHCFTLSKGVFNGLSKEEKNLVQAICSTSDMQKFLAQKTERAKKEKPPCPPLTQTQTQKK